MAGGRAPYQKGYRLERSCTNYFKERGLECYRVALSGAGPEKGDICLKTGWGQVLKGECKSRKELAKWIAEALGDHDFVVLKFDRGEPMVLQTLKSFADMAQ